jgi:hypothetical protein
MKLEAFYGLVLLSILAGGCVVQTIQPLFAEREYTEYPPLVGDWKQEDDGKEIGAWTFSKDGQRYQLTHTDEKKRQATFNVVAGKIGTNVFLDAFPENPLPGGELNEFMAVHLIGAHTFVKIIKNQDSLSLIGMNYDWLEKYLEANPKAISHVLQDKRVIVTASTKELQEFVARHVNDEKAFGNEIKLVPKKNGK